MTDKVDILSPEMIETHCRNMHDAITSKIIPARYGVQWQNVMRALSARIAELEAKRDRHKNRGDNHWETLRSIREIAKTSGDLERIIQWVNDAGQGYTETAETTLSAEMDRSRAAEQRAAELEAKLAKAVDFMLWVRRRQDALETFDSLVNRNVCAALAEIQKETP